MKRCAYQMVGVGLICTLLLLNSVHAQTPDRKPLPQVPIHYPSDTPEIIIRRAQWVEGAKKEGILVGWGTRAPGDSAKLIAAFNKLYPFIKVNYWRGTGEEIVSKLELEHASGHVTNDLVLGSEFYNYPRWRKIGLLDKFTDIMPAIKSMDKRMYSKFGDWAISGNNPITPQYNTKQVSAAEAPKSWEDLLNSKWRGVMGMTTDMKAWTTLAFEEGGWGIEKTEEFLKKLKQQNLIWAPGHSAGHNLLIAGEYKILVEDYWYHVLRSQEKGASVDWVRVRPVPIAGSALTYTKNAPHPNAAKLFIEWQFSPQGLILFEEIVGAGAASPGSGTRTAKAMEGLPLVYRTEEGIIKAAEMNFEKRLADILGVTPGGD